MTEGVVKYASSRGTRKGNAPITYFYPFCVYSRGERGVDVGGWTLVVARPPFSLCDQY